jgi:hypothetical protein
MISRSDKKLRNNFRDKENQIIFSRCRSYNHENHFRTKLSFKKNLINSSFINNHIEPNWSLSQQFHKKERLEEFLRISSQRSPEELTQRRRSLQRGQRPCTGRHATSPLAESLCSSLSVKGVEAQQLKDFLATHGTLYASMQPCSRSWFAWIRVQLPPGPGSK